MSQFAYLPSCKSASPSGRKASGSARRPVRLALEGLEDRLVPSCNTLSGYVYHDINNNGLYEPQQGETPFANNRIELRNAQGAVVGSTVTDSAGFYQFETDSTISTAEAVQTHSATFPTTLTDYDLTRSLPKFNPELGTLLSVEIVHTGSITSDLRVENTSTSSSATITGNVSGVLTLSGPGFTVALNPSRNTGTFPAAQFDGTIDFQGESGRSFAARTAAASRTLTLTDNLQPFLGTGTFEVREVAKATSTASGGGNVLVGITSRASGTVTVRYHYTPNNCLRPGDYTIVQMEQPAGFIDGKEARDGVVLSNPPGVSVIPVTLTDRDLVNNNFGEIKPVISQDHSPPSPPPVGNNPDVFAPIPSTFPGPNDINVIGKASLFTSVGIDANDPALRSQIAYVDGLYRTLFGYAADDAGLVYWVRQLRGGLSRGGLVERLWDAAPHRQLEILMLYRTYLGRDPGAVDYTYWQGVFASGASETEVTLQILASQEYNARYADDVSYMNALYQQILGRSLEAGAMNYWNGVLAGGGRTEAARQVLASAEARLRLMHTTLGNYLHRSARIADETWWLETAAAGVAPEDVCKMVLMSDEFYNLALMSVQV